MTHHDAKRIATEAGFKPIDTNAPDIMVASHARGLWLSMKRSGDRWHAYIDSRDHLLAQATVTDPESLRAVLAREMAKGVAQ